MLQGKGHQQKARGDNRNEVDPQVQSIANDAKIQQLDLPGVDCGIGREQAGHDIARPQTGAERKHRGPGQPVAPDRNRRDELAIGQPRCRAIDGGPAGLMRIEPGNLGIDEGLDEPHQDRDNPDHPARLADDRRNPAHGQQYARRHSAGGPERVFPIELAAQLELFCAGHRLRAQLPKL